MERRKLSDSKRKAINELTADRIRIEFFEISVESYVVGRFALNNSLLRTAGHVLHRAAEYGLKAYLFGQLDMETLKSKRLGHSLPNLAKEALKTWQPTDTKRFARTIAELNRWERIRYPDDQRTGARALLGTRFTPKAEGYDAIISGAPVETYRIALDDIDALMAELLRALDFNPAYFFSALPESSRRAVSVDNAEESIADACADAPP